MSNLESIVKNLSDLITIGPDIDYEETHVTTTNTTVGKNGRKNVVSVAIGNKWLLNYFNGQCGI